MHLRIATAADIAAIAELHATSWRNAYRGLLPDAVLDADLLGNRLQAWQSRLQDAIAGARRTWLLTNGDQAQAFASVVLDADPQHGHLLDNLHVRPDAKSQGLGRRLLRVAAQWVQEQAPGRPLYLWVLDGNWRAARFYERCGARHVECHWDDHLPGVRVCDHRYRWSSPNALLQVLT